MDRTKERLGIPDYIKMIKEGKDFFNASAAIMLDKNYEEVTPKERTLAKRFLIHTLHDSKLTLELILSDLDELESNKTINQDIFFWTRHDKHGYCSNFHRADIEVGGKIYPTTEHYYQAMKATTEKEQEMIRVLPTPREAKFAGYHVQLRPDWEEVKVGIMLTGLHLKFTQHKNLKEKLLSTGDAILHEDSPWDKYWGYAGGRGVDMLGKLLMQVREELSVGQAEPNLDK